MNQDFEFPPVQELKLKLKDFLEEQVDEKYFLSDKMVKYISSKGTNGYRNPDAKINLDIARPITTDQNKRAGTTNYFCKDLPDNYNLIDLEPDTKIKVRRLIPKEAWRLMGFDDASFDKAQKVNSDAQLYKQAGNSIVVNVIKAVLKEMLKCYQ